VPVTGQSETRVARLRESGSGVVDTAMDLQSFLKQVPETRVPVNSLTPAFPVRQGGTDITHVRLLADASSSAELPSILVQKSNSRIIDGMHRVEVAKLRGEWSIRARLIDCTDEEALVLAIKSNTLHGLPLSRGDRISSAQRVLASHPDWSDRAVARITGVSAKTIASLRCSITADSQLNIKRLGRDGKRHPIVAGEGRQRAAEYITSHPAASLREVARESGVSLGTAHDARDRIRRGLLHVGGEADSPTACPPGTPAVDAAADTAVSARMPAPPSLSASSGAGRGTGHAHQAAWPVMAAKLASDPALRYTEGGRAFLRWMASHSMEADGWREFIDAIPPRWREQVAQLAINISEEWRQFADHLQVRQEAAD
jgi:hypothetical protein